MTRAQSPAPGLATQSSVMNHEAAPHFQAEKRKMEPDLGDTVGHNNPSKIPKMEPKLEPGSPGLNQMRAMGSESLNMLGMSGGSVKVEVKTKAEEAGDLATGKMPGFSGSGSLNKSNPDDNFLLAGSVSLTTEQSQQQTPVDQKDKQQKTNTAAKIRTALEASGLAGNLTPDDLQTLKRLNEIAKSTGLSQEQKSLEASTLLKNNPNVSRLLLKLRTGKNLNQPPKEGGGLVGPMAGGQGYPGPAQVPGPHNGQFPGPQTLSGLTGPGGRASPASGHYNSNYGQHQPGPGQNNNNYYAGHTGHHPPTGQWSGGPAPGSPGYYRPEMTGHMAQRMHPDMVPSNFPAMARAGPGANMYGMGMMERMHGMGQAPRTMYMNRQTGMLMQPEYPGAPGGPPGQAMMGPRPGFHGSVPPPYMSPGHTGYHPGPSRQAMMAQRMPVTPMMTHPGHHPGPGHYEMSPGQRANNGGMYPEYGGDNFATGQPGIPGNNFTGPEFRENMLSSKFQTGSDFNTRPVPSQMQGPGHQPGVSQLRARLSQPGPSPGGPEVTNRGSELANRLLHGKPQTEPPPSYTEYSNMNNSQNGNNQLTTGSEALFDEIDNSQFEFNILDNNPNESQNSQAFNLDNSESANNGGGQNFDSWKVSSNTSEVRNTMLRKLATAIESNQLTSPGEASRIAQDIEAKAFAAASGETDYQMGIAHHLAQIFSQSKAGPDSESPDSTTWQEPPSGQPAHSSPDSSGAKTAEGPHFPSDTTLNCFQVGNQIKWSHFKLSL